MNIYIPTMGRLKEQTTYAALVAAGLRPILVVDAPEYEAHRRVGYRCVLCPVRGIARTREFILERAGDRPFAQIDDDVVFNKVNRATKKITRCSPPELAHLMNVIVPGMLTRYAHGGLSQRQFVFAKKQPYVLNTGYPWRCVFMNPALFKKPLTYRPVFRYETGEDIWSMICLAKQGLSWFLMTSYCMQEKTPSQGSHFTQETKSKEYWEIVRKCGMEKHLMTVGKDRRKTIRWSSVLKGAKSFAART